MFDQLLLQRSISVIIHRLLDALGEDRGLNKNHDYIIRHWRIDVKGMPDYYFTLLRGVGGFANSKRQFQVRRNSVYRIAFSPATRGMR